MVKWLAQETRVENSEKPLSRTTSSTTISHEISRKWTSDSTVRNQRPANGLWRNNKNKQNPDFYGNANFMVPSRLHLMYFLRVLFTEHTTHFEEDELDPLKKLHYIPVVSPDHTPRSLGLIHSLVFSLRGRVGRNQSPVMWPVWLWHNASWENSWG